MKPKPIAEMKFETALAELESLVAGMEGGQLDLDAAIAAYQRGMALMQHCQAQLVAAEEKIRLVENGTESALPLADFSTVDRGWAEK